MRYNWAQIEQPELTNLKVPYSNTADNFFQNQSIFGHCLNQYNRKQDVISYQINLSLVGLPIWPEA